MWHCPNTRDFQLFCSMYVRSSNKTSQKWILASRVSSIWPLCSSYSKLKTFFWFDSLAHSTGICCNKGSKSQKVEDRCFKELNNGQRSGIGDERLLCKHELSFFHCFVKKLIHFILTLFFLMFSFNHVKYSSFMWGKISFRYFSSDSVKARLSKKCLTDRKPAKMTYFPEKGYFLKNISKVAVCSCLLLMKYE